VDGVSREEMDAYAIETHNRSLKAIQDGVLTDEIVPIAVPDGKGGTRIFDTDEIRGPT
jgi:Thiolase, N-terminal domain.